jgi:lipid-A-disaccharide synthase
MNNTIKETLETASPGESRNIWILAGEASGDVYGARLGDELKQIAKEKNVKLSLSGMGGEKMIASGIPVKVDSTELGVMGVVEVLKLIFTFIRIYVQLVKQAKQERPDTVILIDYPGFNLLFGIAMYKLGIPVVWYICPQVWVWGKWRKPVFAKICRKMLVIFPFEVEVFDSTSLKAQFVGHPLINIVEERIQKEAVERDLNTFLLLPGSRVMEINRLLNPMLDTVVLLSKKHPELTYHLSAPREKIATLAKNMIDKYRKKHPDLPNIEISYGNTGYWLRRAGTGIAASGTVTVECAISNLPLVVGYRMSWGTVILASMLVKLYRGFFTMVNIIANKEVYQEFLQHKFSAKHLIGPIEAILPNGSRRKEVEDGMAEVKKILTPESGSAARQAALIAWDR